MELVYLGLDAHARHCVLVCMDSEGKLLNQWRFATSESEIVRHVAAVQAKHKRLAIEEGSLTHWIANLIKPYVDEVFICDPRENAAIGLHPHKNDGRDAYQLARLLRLGELKRVYHATEDHRAFFKAAVQQYLDLRGQTVALKLKIKSKYRTWGVVEVEGTAVYTLKSREKYLKQVAAPVISHQLQRLYGVLDQNQKAQAEALKEAVALGKKYPEIAQFQQVPGVGVIGAHVFDAYIQTPDRFGSVQKLWRYAQLGICDRSSDGKPLGFRRLDRSGNSELKSMSYFAWKGSLQTLQPNEVRSYYEASLQRTHNKVHARLNTQRKILCVLWTIWKRKEPYRPERFAGLN